MRCLSSISPFGLTLVSVLIGLIFVITLDSEELDVIGNALIGIGGIMVIASVQGDYLTAIEHEKQQKEDLNKQLDALNKKNGRSLHFATK